MLFTIVIPRPADRPAPGGCGTARYGFTYYTVHAPFAEEFAPVIERLRVS